MSRALSDPCRKCGVDAGTRCRTAAGKPCSPHTIKCGTCGYEIAGSDSFTEIPNRFQPKQTSFFHADYTGCTEAGQRAGAASTRDGSGADRRRGSGLVPILQWKGR